MIIVMLVAWADPEREGARGQDPSLSGKSQAAIDILRNTDTDLPREAIGPLGPIASYS